MQTIYELASRENSGTEVTLLWNRSNNRLRVCVSERHSGAYFEVDAQRTNALDVFYHPYSYAACRGIAYDAPTSRLRAAA